MKQKFKKWLCKLFGHKFYYHGGIYGIPRYCDCLRCGKKWIANYKGNIIKEPEKIWQEI